MAVAIFLIILGFVYYLNSSKSATSVSYKGITFYFRQNLLDAKKVTVVPDESFVHNLFWTYDIQNITILFKPLDPKTNGLYRIEAFEFAYKLKQMYLTHPLTAQRQINSMPIESYENITREDGVLKIILVPPGIANQTLIRGGGNRVFVYGKDEMGFDLATIKTILVAMGADAK